MPGSETNPTLFVTTRWTVVCDAARGGDTDAVTALDALFATYWQPLYRYARRKGKSREDAEDLVQGFFAHVLKSEALRKVDRGRGRFRALLLASFNHWMINEWKRGTRQKRGGGVTTISFSWEDAETGLKSEPADETSPDRLFDREWALALLGKVVADLESACAEEGVASQFELLKPCLTTDSARIPYSDLADALGMTEGAARVAVHRLRKRYRRLLVQEVARTLSSDDMVEEEMRTLFAVFSE